MKLPTQQSVQPIEPSSCERPHHAGSRQPGSPSMSATALRFRVVLATVAGPLARVRPAPMAVPGGGMSCPWSARLRAWISSRAGPTRSPACLSWNSTNRIARACKHWLAQSTAGLLLLSHNSTSSMPQACKQDNVLRLRLQCTCAPLLRLNQQMSSPSPSCLQASLCPQGGGLR